MWGGRRRTRRSPPRPARSWRGPQPRDHEGVRVGLFQVVHRPQRRVLADLPQFAVVAQVVGDAAGVGRFDQQFLQRGVDVVAGGGGAAQRVQEHRLQGAAQRSSAGSHSQPGWTPRSRGSAVRSRCAGPAQVVAVGVGGRRGVRCGEAGRVAGRRPVPQGGEHGLRQRAARRRGRCRLRRVRCGRGVRAGPGRGLRCGHVSSVVRGASGSGTRSRASHTPVSSPGGASGAGCGGPVSVPDSVCRASISTTARGRRGRAVLAVRAGARPADRLQQREHGGEVAGVLQGGGARATRSSTSRHAGTARPVTGSASVPRSPCRAAFHSAAAHTCASARGASR